MAFPQQPARDQKTKSKTTYSGAIDTIGVDRFTTSAHRSRRTAASHIELTAFRAVAAQEFEEFLGQRRKLFFLRIDNRALPFQLNARHFEDFEFTRSDFGFNRVLVDHSNTHILPDRSLDLRRPVA